MSYPETCLVFRFDKARCWSLEYSLFSIRCLHVFLLDSKGSLENQTEVVLNTTKILSYFTDMFLIVHVVLYFDMFLYFA